MKKNIAVAAGTGFDFVGYEASPFSLQLLHGGLQVRDADRNVVQPFAAFGDEFGNYGFAGSGFEKFQSGFSDWNHNYPNIFVGHNFFGGKRQPKFFVNDLCIGKRPYGNAEMVKGKRHVRDATNFSSLSAMGSTTKDTKVRKETSPYPQSKEGTEVMTRRYFTLAKMMTSVYSASDSISARPRISAN